MKRNISLFNLVLLVFFLLCGCDKETVNDQAKAVDREEISQKAVDEFYKFRAGLTSVSRAEDDLTIEKVEEMDVPIQVTMSRATNFARALDSDKIDLKLHVIEFSSNGEAGFAIVSGDERTRPVFMYTEKGSITDTAYIVPLAEYIKNIPQICADELYMYYSGETNNEATLSRAQEPRIYLNLKTKWAQGYPYWDLMPIIKCGGESRRAYVGYTVIALAQCMVYCGYWDTKGYDFSEMRNVIVLSTTHPMYKEIPLFLYELGNGFVSYNCQESKSYLLDAQVKLAEFGFVKGVDYVMAKTNSLDKSRFYSSLQANCPTAMSGATYNEGMHTWVLHGQEYYKNTRMICCNYGWAGECDGWYSDWQRPVDQQTMKPKYSTAFYRLNQYLYFIRNRSNWI